MNRIYSLKESRSVSSRELFQLFFRNLYRGFSHGPPIAGEFSFCIRMKNMFCRSYVLQKFLVPGNDFFLLDLEIRNCVRYQMDVGVQLV